MAGAEVQVIGLREFQRDLKRADSALPREMKRGLDEVGSVVVDEAEKVMERQFVTPASQRTRRLKKSLRSRSTQREGRVSMGSPARAPQAGWWEFGGSTGSPRGDTTRERAPKGRALWPSFEARQRDVVAEMEALLNRLVRIIDQGA